MADTQASDERWMAMALQMGRRGLGRVWPNPAVGCVIVKNGRVLGRGNTQPGGRPHAEVRALSQAGPAARGATAYVTLEPCAHTGKTPPCAEALIKSGVARVVTALTDPDPRVMGKGHQMLRDAGIEVTPHVMMHQAYEANRGFLSKVTKGRPMVTLKLATTLDGKIATATGHSQWITGSQARAYTHLLRAQHDAVMVGSGTVLADDPDLRVRHHGLTGRRPVRVVLDSNLKTPLMAKMIETAAQTPVWFVHSQTADEKAVHDKMATGCKYLPVADSTDGLNLSAAMQTLGDQGLTRVFCEGGGNLAAGLLQAGLVDQLIVMTAGKAVGGDGLSCLAAMGIDQLHEAPQFDLISQRRLGADSATIWDRKNLPTLDVP
jgi:diaminohydroxyphosphoribosylaminopyrimidine deaminase/5-amino-6-(5-phosphoribosylamino)uracil reductase